MNDDNTPVEVWLPIVGLEGFYSVSNHGRVMRMKNANNVKSGRIRNPAINSQYLFVGLYADKVRTQAYIHRLVAEAFLGKCPDGYQVNHIDGNKLNNHVSNLEYCAPKENIQHAIRMGLRHPTKGETNGMSKLTHSQVEEIRRLYAQGNITQRELGRRFCVGQVCISKIILRKSWK